MKNISLAFLAMIFCFSGKADVNVRTGPIQLLTQTWNVELDFPISSAWTLGPTLQFVDAEKDGYEVEAFGAGVRGNYYFNGSVFTQGWYFGPSLSYVKVEVVDKDSLVGDLKGSASGVGFIAMFGYQWMWESFNINLGLGPGYVSISEVELEDDSGTVEEDYDDNYSGATLALEFTLGWKF